MSSPEELFPVELAKQSAHHFITTQSILPLPKEIPEKFKGKAGVFVTIMKRGELRGCIGTISPQTPSIAEEIIMNAISAATRDPRFSPVKKSELSSLTFSVDVLETPEPIASKHALNPKIYGVIVSAGDRAGLLLPDIPGIDSIEQQIEIACRKAGINDGEKFSLARFHVQRYGKK